MVLLQSDRFVYWKLFISLNRLLAYIMMTLLFWVNFLLKLVLSDFTYTQNVPDKL